MPKPKGMANFVSENPFEVDADESQYFKLLMSTDIILLPTRMILQIQKKSDVAFLNRVTKTIGVLEKKVAVQIGKFYRFIVI